uniref:Uncharacterized protein n=1 Tax=Mycena chlorophos TaxID=658473 RepID=A0ABQ0KUV3_MYCCL|nr:predicted protein [Mycena chlorophos]
MAESLDPARFGFMTPTSGLGVDARLAAFNANTLPTTASAASCRSEYSDLTRTGGLNRTAPIEKVRRRDKHPSTSSSGRLAKMTACCFNPDFRLSISSQLHRQCSLSSLISCSAGKPAPASDASRRSLLSPTDSNSPSCTGSSAFCRRPPGHCGLGVELDIRRHPLADPATNPEPHRGSVPHRRGDAVSNSFPQPRTLRSRPTFSPHSPHSPVDAEHHDYRLPVDAAVADPIPFKIHARNSLRRPHPRRPQPGTTPSLPSPSPSAPSPRLSRPEPNNRRGNVSTTTTDFAQKPHTSRPPRRPYPTSEPRLPLPRATTLKSTPFQCKLPRKWPSLKIRAQRERRPRTRRDGSGLTGFEAGAAKRRRWLGNQNVRCVERRDECRAESGKEIEQWCRATRRRAERGRCRCGWRGFDEGWQIKSWETKNERVRGRTGSHSRVWNEANKLTHWVSAKSGNSKPEITDLRNKNEHHGARNRTTSTHESVATPVDLNRP